MICYPSCLSLLREEIDSCIGLSCKEPKLFTCRVICFLLRIFAYDEVMEGDPVDLCNDSMRYNIHLFKHFLYEFSYAAENKYAPLLLNLTSFRRKRQNFMAISVKQKTF